MTETFVVLLFFVKGRAWAGLDEGRDGDSLLVHWKAPGLFEDGVQRRLQKHRAQSLKA